MLFFFVAPYSVQHNYARTHNVQPHPNSAFLCYPQGYAAPSSVQCQCNMRDSLSKLKRMPPQRKIIVASKSPVGDISVVTLIRTDTTLDHSQKAEKVWLGVRGACDYLCGVPTKCWLPITRWWWCGACTEPEHHHPNRMRWNPKVPQTLKKSH